MVCPHGHGVESVWTWGKGSIFHDFVRTSFTDGPLRVLLLETAVMAKMLTFVLPTKKRLVVSFWTSFKYLCNHIKLENRNFQEFLLMQEYLSEVKLDNHPCSALKTSNDHISKRGLRLKSFLQLSPKPTDVII